MIHLGQQQAQDKLIYGIEKHDDSLTVVDVDTEELHGLAEKESAMMPQRQEEEEDAEQQQHADKPPSNASTPLSELSPPPPDDEPEKEDDPLADSGIRPTATPPPPTTAPAPASEPRRSSPLPATDASSLAISAMSMGSLANAGQVGSAPATQDPKATIVLEINGLLFKSVFHGVHVCIRRADLALKNSHAFPVERATQQRSPFPAVRGPHILHVMAAH